MTTDKIEDTSPEDTTVKKEGKKGYYFADDP
jgi:hypothetical protein